MKQVINESNKSLNTDTSDRGKESLADDIKQIRLRDKKATQKFNLNMNKSVKRNDGSPDKAAVDVV